MILAVVGLVLAPLSTSSGENLEHRMGESSLVERHAELGDTLAWVMVPLAVIAAVMWWFGRRAGAGKALMVGVSVLADLAAAGTVVDIALIGHSGAKAAWSDVSSSGE